MFLSPEVSMEIQAALGAEIVMVFDECPPGDAGIDITRKSLEMTARWAKRSKNRFKELQEGGMDTVEANIHLGFPMDKRDYGIGAQILRHLNITKLRLMSNNPKKRAALLGYGIEIVDAVPLEIVPNPHNEKYLQTKRDKLGHEILRD